MKRKQHGGPREGAGRKPIHKAPMQRYQVVLDPQTVSKLKRVGEGNLSAGIRLAAKLL